MSQKLNWGYNDYMGMNIHEFMDWVEKFAEDMQRQQKLQENQMKKAERKRKRR